MGDAPTPTGRDVDFLLNDLLGSSSEDEAATTTTTSRGESGALASARAPPAVIPPTPSPPSRVVEPGPTPTRQADAAPPLPGPDLISLAGEEEEEDAKEEAPQPSPPLASSSPSPSPAAWATPAAGLAEAGVTAASPASWTVLSPPAGGGDAFYTPTGRGGGGGGPTPSPPPPTGVPPPGDTASTAFEEVEEEDLSSAPALDAAEEAERVRAALSSLPPRNSSLDDDGDGGGGCGPGAGNAPPAALLSSDAFVDAPPAPRPGSTLPSPLLGSAGLLAVHAADPYLAGAPLAAAAAAAAGAPTPTPNPTPATITALASFHAVTAAGTSGGSILVVMPRLGLPNPDGTERATGGHVGPLVHRLGGGGEEGASAQPHPPSQPPTSSSSRAVTALAFSPTGTLLAAGHADGDVAFWELRGRAGWEAVRLVRDAHVSPVTALAWVEVPGAAAGAVLGGVAGGLPGAAAMAGAAAAAAAVAGAASAVGGGGGGSGPSAGPPLPTLSALSADARGRVAFHPVPAYQSPLGMAAGSLAGKLVGLAGAVGRAAGVGGGGGSGGGRPALLLDGTADGPVSLAAGLPGSAVPGLVLLLTERAALVTRTVWAGGVGGVGGAARLSVVHSIPRSSGGAAPPAPAAAAAAWRAASPGAASLALAWGSEVGLWDVHLPVPGAAASASAVPRSPRSPGPGASPAKDPPPPPLPPPTLAGSWAEPDPVAALAWMDGPALAVLTGGAGAPAAVRLYGSGGGGTGTAPRETVDLGAPLATTRPPWSAAPDRLVVALDRPHGGQQQQHLAPPAVVALLAWGDRLAALAAAGRWRAALGAALAGVAALRGPHASPLWRGEGRGLSLPTAVQAATDMVAAYARAALASANPSSPPALPPRVAATAVAYLLAADAASAGEAAWHALGPVFDAVPGGADALVGALADAVLGGGLAALPPEAVQALAARAASAVPSSSPSPASSPSLPPISDLERVVLRLELGSLDFNAVARLLARSGGLAGLASLFLRGPGDPGPPGALLLLAAADPGGTPASRQACTLRFLAFLRCCVRGEVFPPGTGPLAPGDAGRARAAALGLLLHSTHASVATAAAELGAALPPGWGEASFPGPHAALRLAAGVDAASAWAVAAEALDGWDALEEEVCASARVPAPASATSSSTRTAAQSTVDAATSLLASRALPPDGAARALALIACLVADGRAGVGAAALHAALEHAALGKWPGGGEAGGGGGGGGVASPHRREALFIRLLRAGAAGGGGEASLDLAAARALARSAGFVRAEAEAHAAAGDVGAALDCLLRSSATDASPAFAYAERVLSGSTDPADPARAALRDALLARAAALAGADGGAAAALILRHFPDDAAAVCAALAATPDLQFAYLRGAVNAAEVLGAVGGGAGVGAGGGVSASSHPSSLLADPATGDLYIRLLARFDPAGLPRFLASPAAAYRAEEALRVVQAARAGAGGGAAVPPSAEAFLRERLGDVAGAATMLAASLGEGVRAVLGARTEDEVGAALTTAAQPALAAAVGLATRARDDLPPAASAALWLQLLDSVADPLVAAKSAAAGVAPPILPAARAAVAGLVDAAAASAAGAAGGLPRRAVGEHLLARHGRAPLADVGGAVAGLLGALAREAALLESAAALAAADAQRALRAVVAARGRALAPVEVVGAGSDALPRRPARLVSARLDLAPAGEAALQAAACRLGGGGDGGPPGSPLHRGGVDVTFLREHDVRL